MNYDDDNGLRFEYRGAAILIIVHILALFIGFTILANVFQFPEVLRLASSERLALYRQNQSIIQPTYWVLSMTGFTQIGISVFLYRSFRNRERTVLMLALVFGIICGILQAAGFIRWAILIPYLAEQMRSASVATAEILGIVEAAFNRYAGMALGEHMANICLGLWTLLTGIAFLSDRLLDRKLAYWGMGLGVVSVILALEQLGIAPDLLSVVLDFGFPAWAIWMLLIAVSLLQTNPNTGKSPCFGWRTLTCAFALYVAMVLPLVI